MREALDGTSTAWLLVTLVLLPAAGCASGGSEVGTGGTGLATIPLGALGQSGAPTMEVRNEASVSASTVPASASEVWRVLPAVFQQLGIEATFVDPRAAAMGNSRYTRARIEGRQLSTYLDCGAGLTGPYADAYAVTLSLLVQLDGAAGGGTEVRTTLDAYARARGVSARPIHCQSRGALERRIWALVAENVQG